MMAAALARHDLILAEAVESSGGRLIKTTGDGGLAAFDSAGDAISAALNAQRNLAAERWSTGGPIRVRMGIHSGESDNRDGDVFGVAVNRAARIMAAGHGGQVLVSGLSAGLAADTLPQGSSLSDLGTHRLKDLTLPEHLYQLMHADLASEFAAPLTLDSRPHNLPLQTTEFLGRTSELNAISALLESPNIRLLTIAGPGGAGKTRLALQVAADQFDHFNDGVFFVDVSMEKDPDAAMEAIVRAIDLPSSGGVDALGLLKTRLRDKQMLLVLDNFEQVTDAAVGIAELLQHAPNLKVIVTSRETLRVRAEFVFPVPPLSLPRSDDPMAVILESESVQLFLERARSVDPRFEPTAENVSTIAEICLRLDGLPLAIELAAARLNVFTPQDLIVRLRDRLDILGSGGRDVPDRQRTLWGAIGWSYELLSARERDLFDSLAVFSTSDLPAIEAVVRVALGEFDVDSLASLVDKSLVQVDDEKTTRRFAMLLMLKEYSAERLAENPELNRTVRTAHARYFSDFAHRLEERLAGAEREDALEELASEIGNLRTAWRFWVEQGDVEQLFNLIDGLWALHEARGWYHAAIELASEALQVLATTPTTPELAAEELVIRTSLARALMAVKGYGPEVEEAFKQILLVADTSGTSAQRFPVLRAMFTYYMNKGDFGPTLDIGVELLAMAEEDESLRVDAHYTYGAAAAFGGKLEEGLTHLDKAIELYDPHLGASRYRMGTNIGVAARVASGLLLWQCGALETGITRVGDALDLAKQLDHPFSVAWALYHNGFLAISRYRFEESLEFAQELARVSDENDYLLWRTLATVLEGVCRTALGESEVGISMLGAAIDLYQGLTTPPVFWPLILSLRAVALAMAGQPKAALELIDDAIAIEGGPDQATSQFLVFKGDFHRMTAPPDPGESARSYSVAINSARRSGFNLIALQALTRLVSLRRETGETPDGSQDLADLYGSFNQGLDEYDLRAARDLLAAE